MIKNFSNSQDTIFDFALFNLDSDVMINNRQNFLPSRVI